MSRSLDKDVLVRLKAEDPKAVYHAISRVLTDLPANGNLLEIEVLGAGHPLEPGAHFLQDGAAVAIPKLKIAQAFFVGRQVLHEYLMSGSSEYVDDQLTRAASTLLLMDPEHLTASNVRKRAVLSSLEKSHGPDSSLLLRRELQFVDSLLTSHLHRHTKSPTLWGHRRWLLEKFRASGVPIDLRRHTAEIVMVSGERHPRNYYAWDHARWLSRDLGRWDIDDAALVAAVAGDVKRWCFKHPSDTSGWSFLAFLTERIPDAELRRATQEAILEETLELAESFRWAGESVWAFLRTAIAKNYDGSQRCAASFALVNEKLSSLAVEQEPTGSPEILQRARKWCDRYHLSQKA